MFEAFDYVFLWNSNRNDKPISPEIGLQLMPGVKQDLGSVTMAYGFIPAGGVKLFCRLIPMAVRVFLARSFVLNSRHDTLVGVGI